MLLFTKRLVLTTEKDSGSNLISENIRVITIKYLNLFWFCTQMFNWIEYTTAILYAI